MIGVAIVPFASGVCTLIVVGAIGLLTCAKKPKKVSPDRLGGISTVNTPTSPDAVSPTRNGRKPATVHTNVCGSVNLGTESASPAEPACETEKPKSSRDSHEKASKEKTKSVESTQPQSAAAAECRTGVAKTKSMTKTTENEDDSFEIHVPVAKEALRGQEIRNSQPVNRNRDDYKTMDHLNLPSSDFDNTISGIKSVR